MENSKKNVAVLLVILAIAAAVSLWFWGNNSSHGSNQGENQEPGQATTTDQTRIVTVDDNDSVISLRQGERFLLKLGELEWNISISDPTVISRVKNIMVVRGAQGIFTADKPGTTTISAEGRPFCQKGQMCAQYIVEFKATIIVK